MWLEARRHEERKSSAPEASARQEDAGGAGRLCSEAQARLDEASAIARQALTGYREGYRRASKQGGGQ